MSVKQNKITPHLWFANNAEEAVAHYLSIFKNSRTLNTTRHTEAISEASGMPVGSVLTIEFELEGQRFIALNGGPAFSFNEAVSFSVHCDTQEEVDYYWDKLGEGGDPQAQICGWLKDKFGLSWQVVPIGLLELLTQGDSAKCDRVAKAMMQMKKLNIAELQRAAG